MEFWKEEAPMRNTVRALSALFIALLLTAIAAAPALACNKTFILYNRSDGSIVQLYVAPHSASSWEDDVLANTSSIDPDMNKRINMSADNRDVSLYDVKAILDDGTKVVGGKINLCRARAIYIYGDRVTYSE
jgi:hypothetical protein